MPEFTAPGVYIQELPSDQQAIRAVSTSNFGTVGWLPRGPVNQATLVGSLNEYFNIFGGYWSKSDTPDAITAFFKNGGARAYVVRVVPSDAEKAEIVVAPSLWTFTAKSEGTWGNLFRVVVQGSDNYYNQATATYSRFDVIVQEESSDGEGDWVAVETFPELDFANAESEFGIITVINDGSDYVTVTEGTGGVIPAFDSTAVTAEAVGSGDGAVDQTFSVTLASPEVAPKTLKISVAGAVVAQDNGKGVIVQVGSSFTDITGTINYTTGELEVTFTAAPAIGDSVTADYYQAGSSSESYELAGGLDGTEVTRAQVSNPVLATNNEGLYALDLVDELLNIGLADFQGDSTVHGDLIAYCENRGDCFAILDVPQGSDSADAKDYKLNTLASLSSYYAMYWPSVKVADNLRGGRPKLISPVGHVAGRYAATDASRNVAKAPAGVTDGALSYVLGLEFNPSFTAQGSVFASNVNPIKQDPLTGNVLWGARTGQLAGDFTQVATRRLFNFLEKSLYNASQIYVFEPLTEDLFTRVKLSFDGFLGALTQQGYFASQNPSEAFRVICDSTNNTAATISQDLLIADILIANANPAEFVLLRFKRDLSLG